MAALVDIFGFLSVLLRGATLSLQTLAAGGVLFLALLRPSGEGVVEVCRRTIRWAAAGLALVQLVYILVDAALLQETGGLSFVEVAGANFFVAGLITIFGASVIALLGGKGPLEVLVLAAAAVLSGTVATSHAGARLDYRAVLGAMTLAHHAATAAWIGGLPYLLLAVRRLPAEDAVGLTARFSRMAMASVGVLFAAGVALTWFYVGSVEGLYGTGYGAMVGTKVALFAILMVFGALNFFLVRRMRSDPAGLLARLRRFAETEIGLGFTIVLAAASLTSQPPAVDMTIDRVTFAAIVDRFTPQPPRIFRWDVAHPPPGLIFKKDEDRLRSYIPGEVYAPLTPEEIAFNEDNHQWAGLFVFLLGILAALASTGRAPWARNWPLVFLGLAVFLFLRADDNYWPLGPEPFWKGFLVADTLQHRLFVPLIVAFAVFERRVQVGRATRPWMYLVFPVVCAAGGALLLTHSHALENVKEELMAELSHIPIAILGAMAGWLRWLELRLPEDSRKIPARLWPWCFVGVGLLLLFYRES